MMPWQYRLVKFGVRVCVWFGGVTVVKASYWAWRRPCQCVRHDRITIRKFHIVYLQKFSNLTLGSRYTDDNVFVSDPGLVPVCIQKDKVTCFNVVGGVLCLAMSFALGAEWMVLCTSCVLLENDLLILYG